MPTAKSTLHFVLGHKKTFLFALTTVLVVLFSTVRLQDICAQGNCPQPAVNGFQPAPRTLIDTFDRAATNRLGVTGPSIPRILVGRPNAVPAEPYVPCHIMKAVGWVESTGWLQFNASYNSTGLTVISFDCGYGIMQITSGMSGGAGFDPARVASSINYNIGTGARILVSSWNRSDIPPVGTNRPEFIENWYYAIWAYNGFVFDNNPNNPAFSPNRPRWACTTQNASQWPYQEKVLGCVTFPPDDPLAVVQPGDPRVTLWTPKLVTLPSRFDVSNPPQPLNDLSLRNGSCTRVFLPLVRR